MSIEIAALAPITQGLAAPPAQVGYGVSLSDIGSFQGALAQASARIEAHHVDAPSQAARQLLRPFEHINGEAARLASDAHASQAAGRDLTPGEMVSLTVRCQEFMFHCQLTSNIANRTSDGLQQLFRQQG